MDNNLKIAHHTIFGRICNLNATKVTTLKDSNTRLSKINTSRKHFTKITFYVRLYFTELKPKVYFWHSDVRLVHWFAHSMYLCLHCRRQKRSRKKVYMYCCVERMIKVLFILSVIWDSFEERMRDEIERNEICSSCDESANFIACAYIICFVLGISYSWHSNILLSHEAECVHRSE